MITSRTRAPGVPRRLAAAALATLLLRAAGAGAQGGAPASELARLYQADQADRNIDPMLFVRLTEAQLDSATRALDARDAVRLRRAEALLARGAAHTADDYYYAAILTQHGRRSPLRAHALAKAALRLDSTHVGARHLFAASWDSYQISLGKPQWYATNVDRGPDGLALLHAVDSTAVSDERRRWYTGWTLAERRASVDSLNARLREERAKRSPR